MSPGWVDSALAVISVIENLRAGLSPANQRIAEVVLARPQDAVRSSISALARASEVSEPTVLRFCRLLGATSFPEFKLALMRELANPGAASRRRPRVGVDDSIAVATDKVFEATIETLRRVRGSLPVATLQHAATAIVKARWVHVYGFGASATVAADAQHKLFRLAAMTVAHSDAHMQAMAASTLGPEDVVLAISNTGRTRELLETVAVAARNGTTIVAISRPGSPLAAMASLLLPVDVEEESAIYTPMTARLAHLVVVDALVVGVALLSPPSVIAERLSRMNAAINRRRVTDPPVTEETA
jgi:RpiR family carbohydrate utilization transcriptional regulator